MIISNKNPQSLEGQLLIATPMLVDSVFHHSVIYICLHSSEGAMGIIINHVIQSLNLSDIMDQLGIAAHQMANNHPIYFGGPVDVSRGFVLHTADYSRSETVIMGENIALTANLEIMKDIASGHGPSETVLALGYAGWEANQLEKEMEENSWISVPATKELIFNIPNSDKWRKSAESGGIDLTKLSSTVGHA